MARRTAIKLCSAARLPRLLLVSLSLLIFSACGSPFSSGSSLTTLVPVSTQGRAIYHQFIVVSVISTLVLFVVLGLVVWVLLHYRGKPGDSEPEQVANNRALEIIWTSIPVLILAGLFVFMVHTMRTVDASPKDPVVITVVGHQWWWEYQYREQNFTTASELHIPVDTPVTLKITSVDVIHSFWVPQLGWKQDAIPGKTNTMQLTVTKAGTYDGTCSEFCGTEHAWMRIRVIAEPLDQFNAWVQQQQQPAAQPATALAREGQQIFESSACVSCHVNSGAAPNLTHFGSREWIGSGVLDNTPANLARWINGVKQVKPGALMPSFNFTQSQLNALVAYLEGQK
ncbi:MAG TPA: cytochrome c oxidase subunit II [Nitrolancea sp.]|jgi:cytochrome c oxidase subunit 2|nr:cytochrome c oxidase subunit II [Nitrolancea sp.]